MNLRTIQLQDIRTDGGTQIRDLDEENVTRLVDVLKEGKEFDGQMRVWFDGENYWLSHGFHRHKAYNQYGATEVTVELLEGSLDDARDDACKPYNSAHGKPETRQEREARVKAYILRHSLLGLREIAKWCGVSHETVRTLRASVKSLTDAKKRTVQRGDQEYEMDVSEIGKSKQDSELGPPPPPPLNLPDPPPFFSGEEQCVEETEATEQDDTPSTLPHVSRACGENEWYTPPGIIERARRTMGKIDLDPASSETAQNNVKAKKYFTIEDDGLTKKWKGRVWMNPPYSKDLCSKFAAKLLEYVKSGDITQACVLVNNATETVWLQSLLRKSSAICLPAGRIQFLDKTGQKANSPLQGQIMVYFGDETEAFTREFSDFGPIFFLANGAENVVSEKVTENELAAAA